MHLYLFLVVVISLSCGSLPPSEVEVPRAILASIGMVAAWALLCHVGARLCALQVKREAVDPIVGTEILEKQLAAFRWLGLGVVLLCLAGFGLGRVLDRIPYVSDSSFLQSLILMAPGMAILVATWSAEHRFGVMLNFTPPGIRNHIATLGVLARTHIAWLLVPVAMLLLVADLVGLLPVSDAIAGWITAAVILLFVPLGLPWLIRRIFKTEELKPVEHEWAQELLRSVGLPRTRILRWDTAGKSFNAMVVGFVPPLRTLLVSDRLLDELPRSQIAMVILHEAAHLKRRHVPQRMLCVLPAWAAGAAFSRLAGDHPWALAVGSAVGILLTMLILRLVAYRTEFDADVQACRLAERMAGEVEQVPADYDQASAALSTALMRVTFDHPSARKATWLHPGVEDRIACIRRQRKAPTTSRTSAATVANPA